MSVGFNSGQQVLNNQYQAQQLQPQNVVNNAQSAGISTQSVGDNVQQPVTQQVTADTYLGQMSNVQQNSNPVSVSVSQETIPAVPSEPKAETNEEIVSAEISPQCTHLSNDICTPKPYPMPQIYLVEDKESGLKTDKSAMVFGGLATILSAIAIAVATFRR